MFRAVLLALLLLALLTASAPVRAESAARIWNKQLLEAIRHDTARPTVHARNLFHLSVAMYDAWAAYDATANTYLHHERMSSADVEGDRAIAVSYAAYRVIRARFTNSPGRAGTYTRIDNQMADLGLDPAVTSTEGVTAAALGNRVAADLLTFYSTDGANESGNYATTNGYLPLNPPLVVGLPGNPDMVDPNRWQPLALDFFVDQSGIILGPYPPFVTPHWGSIIPFAHLHLAENENSYADPGAPPLLGGEGDQEIKDAMIGVITASSQLSIDDGVLVDFSPGAFGNNPLGANSGTGHGNNPITGEPYAPNIAKRGDYWRVIAEYWADGPSSETPPGHWNVIANDVADSLPLKRIGGVGPVINDLEWDVKVYVALNGALHDAAMCAWGAKFVYDTSRPISLIRYMAARGQSSDPELPRFDPMGLPLVPGLCELITPESTANGERHQDLVGHEHEIAIYAWRGNPANPVANTSGVGWILASTWVPFQTATFVTPPFAGYISGHSTFSRSAAEVMTRLTGSPYFPGGMGEIVLEPGYLRAEYGPSATVRVQFATYGDAADLASQSRVYGGIHPRYDDFPGRIAGTRIGPSVYSKALRYFSGTAEFHTADRDKSGALDLSEILRVIQLYRLGNFGCYEATEDGYLPGSTDHFCSHHDTDFTRDWRVDLGEVLRLIQLFNASYHHCPPTPTPTVDGFCLD